MQNQEFKKIKKIKKRKILGEVGQQFFFKNNEVPQLLGQQGGSCWNPQTHLGWVGSAGTRRPTRWADPLGPAAPTCLGRAPVLRRARKGPPGPRQRLAPRSSAGLSGHAPLERGF
jgi:hypothetical protein